MTAYPHRYGDTEAAVEHYATACVASARILRRAGLPEQAADLEDAADRARAHLDHPDHPDRAGHRVNRSVLDAPAPDPTAADPGGSDLGEPGSFDDDGQVPRWWR